MTTSEFGFANGFVELGWGQGFENAIFLQVNNSYNHKSKRNSFKQHKSYSADVRKQKLARVAASAVEALLEQRGVIAAVEDQVLEAVRAAVGGVDWEPDWTKMLSSNGFEKKRAAKNVQRSSAFSCWILTNDV